LFFAGIAIRPLLKPFPTYLLIKAGGDQKVPKPRPTEAAREKASAGDDRRATKKQLKFKTWNMCQPQFECGRPMAFSAWLPLPENHLLHGLRWVMIDVSHAE
jgi:hypothetical protein